MLKSMYVFNTLPVVCKSARGLCVLSVLCTSSKMTWHDLPLCLLTSAAPHASVLKILHNLDYCDVLLVGEELNPQEESLQLPPGALLGKHLDVTNSSSGISIYGEKPAPERCAKGSVDFLVLGMIGRPSPSPQAWTPWCTMNR